MKKLFIICQRYLDSAFESTTIGGIQTYITNLSQIAAEIGFQVHIIQYDVCSRQKEFPYGRIIGVDVSGCKRLRHKNRTLYQHCMKDFDLKTDLLIYATEGMAQKGSRDHAIAIQHGISWDIESSEPVSRTANVIAICKNAINSILLTQSAANVRKMVCVDYNYLNWYRTQVRHHETTFEVIPNFAVIADEIPAKHTQQGPLRILFARRFQTYRGTRLFASVIKRLMAEYPTLQVTFAGDGPDEPWLHEAMAGYPNVSFIKYTSDESIAVHSAHHIAVVPTTGSEGTSLSLLEAMSAQCAVVCTNVGGMTNIIIDHYNGLMVTPDEHRLYCALKELIDDRSLRIRLAAKGYETLKEGFSHQIWKDRWTKVLLDSAPGGHTDPKFSGEGRV